MAIDGCIHDVSLQEAKATADEIYRAIAAVKPPRASVKKVTLKDDMVDRQTVETILARKYKGNSRAWSNNVTRTWDTITLLDDIVYCKECLRQHRSCPHASMKGYFAVPVDIFIRTELPEERYFQTPAFKENFEYVQKYLKKHPEIRA